MHVTHGYAAGQNRLKVNKSRKVLIFEMFVLLMNL
jgi:hypothetical protein